MKKLINLTAILLILAGGLASCKDKEKEGSVPYRSCPCKNEPLGTVKGDIRLFIDPDSTITYSHERMVYSHDRAYLTLKEEQKPFPHQPIGHICNFPDFAKQWKAPEGVVVYYEGIIYPNCEEFGCRVVCYSIILTKLKIR